MLIIIINFELMFKECIFFKREYIIHLFIVIFYRLNSEKDKQNICWNTTLLIPVIGQRLWIYAIYIYVSNLGVWI